MYLECLIIKTRGVFCSIYSQSDILLSYVKISGMRFT